MKNRSQIVVFQNVSSNWFHLYQGVPQGTILGLLLFNLYVNSMINTTIKPCELVQYADDTFLFVANENIEEAIRHLELNISKMVLIFQCHRLNLNKTKTDFIIFCKKAQSSLTKTLTLQVDDHLIEPSSCVKYLGVHLDQSLTFEVEIKKFLKKMACGIETLYTVKPFLPEEFCLKLLNALVLSQIEHPAILLNAILQNLITSLEKQLSWAVKACQPKQI